MEVMIREWYRDCSVYGTSTNGGGQTASPAEELAERRTLERYYGTYSSDDTPASTTYGNITAVRRATVVNMPDHARRYGKNQLRKKGGTLSELMRVTEERAIGLCC